MYVSLCVLIGNKRPTLHDVYNYVVPKCAHKWKFLGVLLHFDQDELDIIFSNFHNDSEECCRSLLSRWLEKNSVASWKGSDAYPNDNIKTFTVWYIWYQAVLGNKYLAMFDLVAR